MNPEHEKTQPLNLNTSFNHSIFVNPQHTCKMPTAKLSLNLPAGSKIIIPISMGRYAVSKKSGKEYDNMLSALFSYTASLLQSGFLLQVDVIATTGLQRISWDDDLIDQTDRHFFNTHKELLEKQSNQYRWDEWIDLKGRDIFNENYTLVTEKSEKNTEWYNLMVKTHHSVKMSSDLEKSVEYQRREYAAIILMSQYSHLVYVGQISLAWAYMYHIFDKLELPLFTRVVFEDYARNDSVIGIGRADAGQTVKLILSNIEQTLTNQNFPNKEKEKLVNAGLSLFYAYGGIKKQKTESHPFKLTH